LKLRHPALSALREPNPSKKRLPLSTDVLIDMVSTFDPKKIEGAMMITASYMGFLYAS